MAKAKKWLKGLKKLTEASNRAYAKMTPEQKRVTIAKDVLKALEADQIVAEHGEYFDGGLIEALKVDESKHPLDGHATESLQTLLPKLPACHVCAKGALFVACVSRQNAVKVGDGMRCGSDQLSRQLQGVFSTDQLQLIENAFEGFGGYYRIKGRSAKERMAKIMRNVIENNGTFVMPRECT